MTSGYPALTEKEKQTLRLLLGGHDAKSIARHLELSVHTIHERLREARRKLGTSSSREAARVLGDIEAQTPQLLGDTLLRDAGVAGAVQSISRPARGPGDWRHLSWTVGGLAMIISLALLALAAVSAPVAPVAPVAPAVPEAPVAAPVPASPSSASEAAAVDAARQFLALTDRDDWRASWQATHRSFQLLNTVEWWAQASRQVRGDVGTPLSRELATVDFTAAPPNGYWIVRFKARYSKKGAVIETLHLASEDSGWKVAAIMVD